MRISDWSSDVCSSDLAHELALHVELRDGRPIGIVFNALADLRVLEHVDRLEGDAEMVEDRHRARRNTTLRKKSGALHESDDVVLADDLGSAGSGVGHIYTPHYGLRLVCWHPLITPPHPPPP